MYPLLPFAAGMLAGAVVLRLLKADTTKAGLAKAQRGLRDATVSGLETIENASARARVRLTSPAAADAARKAAVAAPSKPRRARASRKRATKPAAEEAS